MNNENIIREVVSSNLQLGNIEKQFNRIKKELESKNVVDLLLKDLKSLLAYETWKDGSDIEFVLEILKSKDSKLKLLKQLEVFGY